MRRNPSTDGLLACSLLAVLLVTASLAVTEAGGKGEGGPIVASRVEPVDGPVDLDLFRKLDLDVDGVFDRWARVHLTAEETNKLIGLGYRVIALPPEPKFEPGMAWYPTPRTQRSIPAAYHTYATLTSELQAIAAANPDLVRLDSIGQSVQGRELWIVKLSDNPDLEEDEPEVAYIAAMHGDEVVGKELCIGLIHALVDGYGTDPRLTSLVDENEIWILPSLNPDGTELGQRYNANGVDLNRDYPDWYSDPNNIAAGRQAETQAVMAWTEAHAINLSANFHGGALVANYPFDNNPSGSAVFSPAPLPDHDTFLSVSLTYAENNPPMYASSSFPQGVTNGAEWYVVEGGLQDWSYTWYGNFDLTLEVSNVKWPAASQLPGFWDDNIESMLSYLERAAEGVRGVVTDSATGAAVAAAIRIDSDPFAVRADPDVGDYHRIVLPGSYTMEVSAPGFYPQTIPVTVAAGPAARYDLQLQPLPADLQPVGSRVDDGVAGDGLLDPDETADLAVRLKNLGNSATSVVARLVPTGWYGEVVRSEASFPDLANQAEAESAAPHYEIHVDPAVPAGHRLGYALEWEADQGGGLSEPFFLDVGGSSCSVTAATDVPQSILDYQTLSSTIVLSGGPVIDEVRVTVDLIHTYIGDLRVTLTSPTGTQLRLHDRSGSGTDDIVGTYGLDLTPADSLDALAGELATGSWTLTVEDQAGGDTGSLEAWSLEVCGWPQETQVPEMRLRALSRDAGGVRIEWWSYPGLTDYRLYRSNDASLASSFLDVTVEDADATDTLFLDTSTEGLVFYLVTGVGPMGEGLKGHFGE